MGENRLRPLANSLGIVAVCVFAGGSMKRHAAASITHCFVGGEDSDHAGAPGVVHRGRSHDRADRRSAFVWLRWTAASTCALDRKRYAVLERWVSLIFHSLQELGRGTRLVRVVTNTPSAIGAGAGAVCGGTAATEEDIEHTLQLMRHVGLVHRLPEHMMDGACTN